MIFIFAMSGWHPEQHVGTSEQSQPASERDEY